MSVGSVVDNRFSPSRSGRDAAGSAPLLGIRRDGSVVQGAFGRGPTRARTLFAGPHTVVVVLEDALTAAERSLLSLGEVERLRQSRMAVQEALEERARSLVEEALGRRTVAFITGIDPARDIALTGFTLDAPAVEDRQSDGATLCPRAA